MEVKLYVGNMPYSTTEDQLGAMFAEAGQVVDVAIIKDRDSGTPKGFAFVTMASQDEAQKAITLFNGKEVGGRALTVNPARPREERPMGGRGGYGGGGGYRSDRGNDRGGYNRR